MLDFGKSNSRFSHFHIMPNKNWVMPLNDAVFVLFSVGGAGFETLPQIRPHQQPI